MSVVSRMKLVVGCLFRLLYPYGGRTNL